MVISGGFFDVQPMAQERMDLKVVMWKLSGRRMSSEPGDCCKTVCSSSAQ